MPVNFKRALVRASIGTFGLAVCTGLLLAGAATAGPATDAPVPVQMVSSADLDLSSPPGRATLKLRIRAAARNVCDIGRFGSADPWLRLAERQCYHDAIRNARPYTTVTAER